MHIVQIAPFIGARQRRRRRRMQPRARVPCARRDRRAVHVASARGPAATVAAATGRRAPHSRGCRQHRLVHAPSARAGAPVPRRAPRRDLDLPQRRAWPATSTSTTGRCGRDAGARQRAWRMLRNPSTCSRSLRDRIRYRGRIHRAVVALTHARGRPLRRDVRPSAAADRRSSRTASTSSGSARRPPPSERAAAREPSRLDDDDRVVAVFIGHEFARKGLALAIEALVHAPTVLLLVVGGNADDDR